MIEYNNNKEKRTVVAFIKFDKGTPSFKNGNDIFDDLWSALKRFKSSDSLWGNDYRKKVNKMYFPKYVSAKAKCNPEDEWNEEYGKQLARQRLVEKIKRYRSNSYCIIADLAYEINEFVM